MCGWLGMAMQGKPPEVFDLRLDRLEKARVAAFQESDRDAVAIEHTVAREGGELRPGRENSGEVEWIGARDRDETVVRRTPPHRPQRSYGLGQRELLAR